LFAQLSAGRCGIVGLPGWADIPVRYNLKFIFSFPVLAGQFVQ
jgi:hypothetical protein